MICSSVSLALALALELTGSSYRQVRRVTMQSTDVCLQVQRVLQRIPHRLAGLFFLHDPIAKALQKSRNSSTTNTKACDRLTKSRPFSAPFETLENKFVS